jgi:DNA-binding transcriptional MerR regulator
MNWNIPGTVLVSPREDAKQVPEQFTSMFLGGGMVLSQVSAVTGLEPHTVQNWVKRGFLAPPVRKRYDLEQFCRIATINALKNALPLETICQILSFVNGQLTDSADDVIDDQVLYFMFVELAADLGELFRSEDRDSVLEEALSDYQEPVPGARERIKKALSIMLTAYLSAKIRQEAEYLLSTVEFPKI